MILFQWLRVEALVSSMSAFDCLPIGLFVGGLDSPLTFTSQRHSMPQVRPIMPLKDL